MAFKTVTSFAVAPTRRVTHLTCCVSTCRPPVFEVRPTSTTAAAAFLVSPDEALTALHILPSDDIDVRIGDHTAKLLRKNIHADLALLKLDTSQQYEALPFAMFSSRTTYTVVPPPPRTPLPVTVVDVVIKLASFSGALVPFVRFRTDNPVRFEGWSGSPIVRDDTGAPVAILVQGFEEILETISTPIIDHLRESTQPCVNLARLPGLILQPLIHPAAKRAFLQAPDPSYHDYLRKGDDNDEEDVKDEGGDKPFPPRVAALLSEASDLRVGDLLYKLKGYSVRSDGTVNWGGLKAPIEVAIATCEGHDEVTAEVIREGIQCQARVRMTSATTLVAGQMDRRIVTTDGLIFAPLSVSLLRLIMPERSDDVPNWLQTNPETARWDIDINSNKHQDPSFEIVILLAFDNHFGWNITSAKGLSLERVVKVDGCIVQNLNDLIGSCNKKMMIELSNGFTLLLSRGEQVTAPEEFWTSITAS